MRCLAIKLNFRGRFLNIAVARRSIELQILFFFNLRVKKMSHDKVEEKLYVFGIQDIATLHHNNWHSFILDLGKIIQAQNVYL